MARGIRRARSTEWRGYLGTVPATFFAVTFFAAGFFVVAFFAVSVIRAPLARQLGSHHLMAGAGHKPREVLGHRRYWGALSSGCRKHVRLIIRVIVGYDAVSE